MNISSLSKEIYLSRGAIRSQIIEEVQNNFDLVDVDLTKSSFLSYVINILSTLTANILFYQISVYREFFLTKAQLDSSVMNGAASIGYKPDNAKCSSVSLILSFPFRFEFDEIIFILSEGTEFSIDTINFVLNYSIKVIVTANSMVQCYQYKDGKSELVPVVIVPDTGTSENIFKILINVDQVSIEKFEFSVNDSSSEYRFTDYHMKTAGQISDIKVVVIEDGNTIEQKYEQFSSIYLMSATDYGFVTRKTDAGYKLSFGNGLIGVQPKVGSKIMVTAYTTLGIDGNIRTGVLKNTPRIMATSSTDGSVFAVNYDVINPTPGVRGKNEPTLEEVKYIAIDNLTALHRLVSENDYKNVGTLIPDTPLASHTYPVLKRSDIRTNEIQLYTLLEYNNNIVPTENIFIELDENDNMEISKYSVLQFDGEDFITPFDIKIDPDLEVTKYKYITNSVRYNLVLEATNIPIEDYVFFGNYLFVQTGDNKIKLKMFFQTMEIDYSQVTCTMDVSNTMINIPMEIQFSSLTTTLQPSYTINDLINTDVEATEGYFELIIEPYERLPESNEKYTFVFSHATLGQLNTYSVNFTFRKNLDQMMLSNTIVDDNTHKVMVCDIPVINKKYYDDVVDKEEFEYHVLQRIIDNVNFEETKMITDFINIKFANTSIHLKNMLLNKETRLPVDYIDISSFDHIPQTNERFIVNNDIQEWKNEISGYIAICSKGQTATEPAEWIYVKPEMDDMIYARNTNKKYVYTGHVWVEPLFEIPLLIEADVRMQDNYSIDKQAFINEIKENILTEYKDRMICQSYLNRSELVSTIQTTEGVDHCRLIKPIANIFYNFILEELTDEELLHYTPEMLYFTKDNISLRLVK